MHLITGKKGEPHITAENHGFINAQILGNGNFVFDFGNNFAAVKLNDNSVEIKDGQGMFGGRHFEIEYGTTENVTIEKGTLGLNRIDLIVARYAKDSEGIETLELAVKKGTAVSGNPEDPYYDTRTPYTGADGGEFPLWRVNIIDTTIISLEPVYDIVDFDFAQLQLDIQTALGEFEDAMGTINGKSNKDNTPKVWAGSGDPFTVADDTEWPESSEIKVGDIYVKIATNEFYFVKLVTSGGQGTAKLPQWVKLLTAADIANKPTEFKGTGDPFTVPTTTAEEQVKVGDFYVKKSGSLRVGFWICDSVTIESGEITEVEWEEVALSAYYLVRDETIKFFYGAIAPNTTLSNYPGVVSGDVYIETGTGDYYSNRRVNNIKGLWIAKISNNLNLSWEEVALTKNTIKREDGIKVYIGNGAPTSNIQDYPGITGGDIYYYGAGGTDRNGTPLVYMYYAYIVSGSLYWNEIMLKRDTYTKTETDNLLASKQDTLTAGNNIVIDANNTISYQEAEWELLKTVEATEDNPLGEIVWQSSDLVNGTYDDIMVKATNVQGNGTNGNYAFQCKTTANQYNSGLFGVLLASSVSSTVARNFFTKIERLNGTTEFELTSWYIDNYLNKEQSVIHTAPDLVATNPSHKLYYVRFYFSSSNTIKSGTFKIYGRKRIYGTTAQLLNSPLNLNREEINLDGTLPEELEGGLLKNVETDVSEPELNEIDDSEVEKDVSEIEEETKIDNLEIKKESKIDESEIE